MSQIYKNYLDLLNIHQQEAVINTEGAYLVLAGAGSGKTRVLTYRLLHILLEKKAFPNQILAVTFTNKAALEMKSRVIDLIQQPIDNIWMGTFHSISAKILRKHAALVGLKSNFVILDTEDQLKIISQICERKKINTSEKSPKYFLSVINQYKNKALTWNDLIKDKNTKKSNVILTIYKNYEIELVRLNCVDFGDLLLHCIKIFKEHQETLKIYQKPYHSGLFY